MPALQLIPLPAEKRRMVEQIRDGLRRVAHIQAIVLGGSHACGLARPDSDLDIGVYYREGRPFSVDEVRALRVSQRDLLRRDRGLRSPV